MYNGKKELITEIKEIYIMLLSSTEALIGNTPLVELVGTEKAYDVKAHIYAKLEGYSMSGSVKDRIAKSMIDDAEKSGKLKKGSTIIEPTSGNTGIGLAAVAAIRGYKIIIVMPETMSVERRKLMAQYGAKIVLSPGNEGMKGAIRIAKELAESTENSFIPGQFENPANPAAHYATTGPEIFNDLNGNVSAFIAGVGTGGTITGTASYLKEKISDIKIVAVEPASSPVLSKGQSGPHKIQGIGAGFIPDVLNTEIYDEIIAVENGSAFEYGKAVARNDGILCGISSGAALFAAVEVAKRDEFAGKNIVVLLPDSGDRYLSTPLFDISEDI